MTRPVLIPLCLLAALLAGCGAPARTDVTLTRPPVFLKGEAAPLTLQLHSGGAPASGYAVTAQFSMARMDHGQQEVTLKEAAPGTYTGEVALPMGGEWDVTVNATRDRDTLEQTLTLRVNDGG